MAVQNADRLKRVTSQYSSAQTAQLKCLRPVVFLYLTSNAYVHLTLYKDVLPMIQMLLNLILTIALSMVVAIILS